MNTIDNDIPNNYISKNTNNYYYVKIDLKHVNSIDWILFYLF